MIEYRLIKTDKVPEVAQYLIDNFFVDEPFGLALGLTTDQVQRWYPEFLATMLNHSAAPVSFIAVDSNTGKIAGSIINMIIDPCKPPPPSMKEFLDPEKEPIKIQIATFLEQLEEGLDVHKILGQPEDAQIFACLFLSVAAQYGGQGIAKELVRMSEEHAKKVPGVTIAMTDVTSEFSYRAFQKLGYKMVKEVEYIDYEDPDGNLLFANKAEKLGVHTHARVIVKVLI